MLQDQADAALKRAVEPALLAVIIETGLDAMQAIGMQPSEYDPYSEAITAWFNEHAPRRSLRASTTRLRSSSAPR